MKILVEFELELDGDISEATVREKFVEWFPGPMTYQIVPEEMADEGLVWISGWSIREEV